MKNSPVWWRRSSRRVDIGRVHYVHRTGFEGEQIEHVEVMQHPIGDTRSVAARHATLASGWRAAPSPGRC